MQAESSIFFVSFGVNDKLGLELYDTTDAEKEKGLMIVESVTGVAQLADIPPGSVVAFVNEEKIQPGLSQDDFMDKVRDSETKEVCSFGA